MAKEKILVYGATGFMGRMIAELAVEQGLPIILAGRSPEKLAALDTALSKTAAKKDVPYWMGSRRAFPLEAPAERAARLKSESQQAPRTGNGQGAVSSRPRSAEPNRVVDAALSDVRVVLNAAGPFGATADPLARGCIRTRTQYLDICGEHDVIDALRDLSATAKKSLLMPGVGLTVLCSDLLVRRAVEKGQLAGMSEPHIVRVALSRVPFVSRGSAKTMLNSVRNGVLVNRSGNLKPVSIGQLTRSFDFGTPNANDIQICTALTLADLRTAGNTAALVWKELTGKGDVKPSVETYVEASMLERLTYQVAGEFAFAFRTWPVKSALDGMLRLWPEGPPSDERNSARQQVVVEVEDRYRRAVRLCLDMPNSYDFTASVALKVAKLLLAGNAPVGFVTPARITDIAELLDAPTEQNPNPPKLSCLSYHGLKPTEEVPKSFGERA